MIGKKHYIKWENVKVIKVPQYKSLSVKDILQFAQRRIRIDRFLPKYDNLKDPNREWLCYIINSIISEKFQKIYWLKSRGEIKQLISSQNLGISVQSELMNIFKKSNSISTVKGKSHFQARMPKPTKDKLTIRKFKEERIELNKREMDVENQLAELKEKFRKIEEDQKRWTRKRRETWQTLSIKHYW